jgi:2-phospho-L-lactate guanylyltransferase
MTALADVAVVVPIKSFALAKSRLADSLSADSRRELARHCAEAVLRAASPLSVYVVCNDDEVAAWARANGAHVVVPGVLGLNAAATAGRDAARAAGHHRVMVAHSDLPHAKDLASLCEVTADAVVVPDRHGDGTNVLLVPCRGEFTFAYGPGSCAAHRAEAALRGLSMEVIQREDLTLDVDTLDDLRLAGLSTSACGPTSTQHGSLPTP